MAQDRHRRHSHEEHPKFHCETGNDEGAVSFDSGKSIASDLFDRNINELWPGFGLATGTFRDFSEFGVYWPRAECGNTHASAA